jgi:hypothetical protein
MMEKISLSHVKKKSFYKVRGKSLSYDKALYACKTCSRQYLEINLMKSNNHPKYFHWYCFRCYNAKYYNKLK